jgi:hypothetical protein
VVTRKILSQRRSAQTSVGYYDDGCIGEIFVDASKSGQDLQAIARDAAVVISLALQHGAPLSTIRHAITRNGRNEPASILGAIIDRLSAFPSDIGSHC